MLMRHSKNKKALIGVFAALLVLGIIFLFDNGERKSSDGTVFNTSEWQVYENEKYNFEIKYPASWSVAETNDFVPMISIYKAGQVGAPFDHFANATHVSVYPKGIPTEGVVAERQEASIEIKPKTQKANDLLLDDGKIFATFYSFTEAPESWEPWGFLWAHNITDDGGVANKQDRALIEAILQTFRFTE